MFVQSTGKTVYCGPMSRSEQLRVGSFVVTPSGRVGRWADVRIVCNEEFAVVQSGGDTILVRPRELLPAF